MHLQARHPKTEPTKLACITCHIPNDNHAFVGVVCDNMMTNTIENNVTKSVDQEEQDS